MPYASKDDLIARFGADELLQITDRTQMGVIDDTAILQAQEDGDGEINMYLRQQVQLPLLIIPPNLVRLACDIYRYYLYGNLVPDYAQKRYDSAVATLKLIGAGKLDLDSDHDQAPTPVPQVHFAPGPLAALTTDKLKNF